MTGKHKGCLRPCVTTFERLAKEAPELLIAWVQTGYGLDAADLSFACEALGELMSEANRARLDYSARIALIHRLDHPSPIVREGVVYGLAGLGDSAGTLWRVWQDDASPGVREAARDAIDALATTPAERDDTKEG